MKSMLDKQINGQGFLLYRDKVTGKPRSHNFGAELQYNLVPKDTTSLVTKGAALNEYRIALPEQVEVHYTNEFSIETGISITGIYKDKKGRDKKTNLTLVPENLGGIHQVATDKNGTFSLTNHAFYDSTKFVRTPAEGEVVLLPKEYPALPETLSELKFQLLPLATSHRVFTGDTLQARILETVNVKAKKRVTYENSYAQPDVILKGESLESYGTMADAIAAKLPSFKLIYYQTNWYLIWVRASVPTSADLRKQNSDATSKPDLASHEPNLYINNVQVVGETAGDRLMQLSPTQIDHIEVNGMISSNQGANGSNGLINVFTKRTAENTAKPLSILTVKGFDRELRFRSQTMIVRPPRPAPTIIGQLCTGTHG